MFAEVVHSADLLQVGLDDDTNTNLTRRMLLVLESVAACHADVLDGVRLGPDPRLSARRGGRVYVTGPYGGGPFGLSVMASAGAGPFDLGIVVVRAAVFVDRHTAALRAVTDRLPRMLEGIPLQLRDVRVAVDRPGFMVSPTGCGAKRVRGMVESVAGRVVGVASRF